MLTAADKDPIISHPIPLSLSHHNKCPSPPLLVEARGRGPPQKNATQSLFCFSKVFLLLLHVETETCQRGRRRKRNPGDSSSSLLWGIPLKNCWRGIPLKNTLCESGGFIFQSVAIFKGIPLPASSASFGPKMQRKMQRNLPEGYKQFFQRGSSSWFPPPFIAGNWKWRNDWWMVSVESTPDFA